MNTGDGLGVVGDGLGVIGVGLGVGGGLKQILCFLF